MQILEDNNNPLKCTSELHDYQIEGVNYLLSKRHAILAFDMGLGKSATTIRALDIAACKNILIICPATVRDNWRYELEKWSRYKRTIRICYSYNDIKKTMQEGFCKNDLVLISSFDGASKEISWLTKEGVTWDAVVVDEGHYLKNIEAKRTQNILGSKGLVHRCKHFWSLTGTPLQNNLGDLWVYLYVFKITKMKYLEFVHHYCVVRKNDFNGIQILKTKDDKIEEVKMLVSKSLLRKGKDVLTGLPPIRYGEIILQQTDVDLVEDANFSAYLFPRDRRVELMHKIQKEQEVVKKVLDLGRNSEIFDAAQIAAKNSANLRRYIGLQKMTQVAGLVNEELDENLYSKIVIFAWHTSVVMGLKDRLFRWNPVHLSGNSTINEKAKALETFKNNKHCRVFIGNIISAGTGIDLTVSNQVLFCESTYVPSDMAQAVMRCHRIGQEKPVFVRFASLSGSVDEAITSILKRKTEDLTRIIDTDLKTIDDYKNGIEELDKHIAMLKSKSKKGENDV